MKMGILKSIRMNLFSTNRSQNWKIKIRMAKLQMVKRIIKIPLRKGSSWTMRPRKARRRAKVKMCSLRAWMIRTWSQSLLKHQRRIRELCKRLSRRPRKVRMKHKSQKKAFWNRFRNKKLNWSRTRGKLVNTFSEKPLEKEHLAKSKLEHIFSRRPKLQSKYSKNAKLWMSPITRESVVKFTFWKLCSIHRLFNFMKLSKHRKNCIWYKNLPPVASCSIIS